MTHENNEARAAEYVLGTLEGEERRHFIDALVQDAQLQALVTEWEQLLQGLEQMGAMVAPSAELWQKIEAALGGADTGLFKSVTLRADEGEWEQLADGIEKKILFFDKAARSESYLMRIAPGTRLPSHDHSSAEECLVIEGTFDIGDIHLKVGDYHAIDAGTTHPDAYSEHGAVIYVRGELREAAG